MSSELEILILAKSKKFNNYCIAGYDTNNQKMVRIISNNPKIHYAVPTEDIIMANTKTEVAILDHVKIKAIKVNPINDNPHQVENWVYDRTEKWKKIKSLAFYEIPTSSFSTDKYLFFNTKHILNKQDMSSISTGLKSLQLIKPSFLEFYVKEYEGAIKIYANLQWHGEVYKRLSVTDPNCVSIIEEMCKNMTERCFYIKPTPVLLISLSSIFEHDLCYYKLIASVIVDVDREGVICSKQHLYFLN